VRKRDLGSLIANAQVESEPIAEAETSAYYLFLTTAGHHTTTAALVAGLRALLQHPDQMQALRSDVASMQGAIQEILRFTSPVRHLLRIAAEECTLRDCHLRRGDLVLLCYPSGNRDEVFDNPADFRIKRRGPRHLTFGHGPHICLGQHLAILEMSVFLKALLKRVRHIELMGEPVWMHSSLVTALRRLPIRYRLK
jgi:cytochrome P450